MAPDVRIDQDTIDYFDEHTPEYSSERLAPAAREIRRLVPEGGSLVDLGCGAGNTLEYLRDAAGLGRVAGIDVSPSYLGQVRDRIGDCETHEGSILDTRFISSIAERYDVAVIAAVLHHLIGRTRAESRAYARLAIENAALLLKPGGHVVVHEPVYYPASAMSALFYLKKAMTRISNRRVPIGGYWNNIGAPVVSYYTNERLREMISAAGLDLVGTKIVDEKVPAAVDRFVRKTSSTFVAHKPS